MVSKGLAGAAAFALALASAGAFAPGRAFVNKPLSPSTYGIDVSDSVSSLCRKIMCLLRLFDSVAYATN